MVTEGQKIELRKHWVTKMKNKTTQIKYVKLKKGISYFNNDLQYAEESHRVYIWGS